MWTTIVSKRNGGKIQQTTQEVKTQKEPPTKKKSNPKEEIKKENTKKTHNSIKPDIKKNDDGTHTMEKLEWQKKYNPRTLQLGMVRPNAFVDVNDKELFGVVKMCIDLFEKHLNERLPEDFRKYLLYCGPMFFNWSVCGISLNGWNQKDKNDQTRLCLWCESPLENTRCKCKKFFDGTKLDTDEIPGLIRFCHEGCGVFTYIVVKGPLKGTLWKNDPNRHDEKYYLRKIKPTFKEFLDNIYKKD